MLRGKPSRMKPPATSGSARRSSIMPSTVASSTSLPASITAFAFWPSGVPRATAERSRSPVEICGMPKRCTRRWDCVPLPEPGAPRRTMRMRLLSSLKVEAQYRYAFLRSNRPLQWSISMRKAAIRPRTAFYAQSGGVTAVINASAAGVIEAARRHRRHIGKVLAGRDGIIGGLTEDLIDVAKEPAAVLRGLRHTPAGAFGSARFKLKGLEQNRAEYERLIEV